MTEVFPVEKLALRPGQFSDYASEAIRYAETGLQVCSLLKQRPVVLELGFELARLLAQHTIVGLRKGNDEWKEWEALFEFCLDLGAELGWVYYAPEIHRIRKEFFESADRPTATTDVYNSYKAMKAAHFPLRVVTRCLEEARRFLTNHSKTRQEYLEAGELMELWANDFSILDSSAPFRRFGTNANFDQADALIVAAQNYLRAGDVDRAGELLRRAETVIDSVPTGDFPTDQDRHRCRIQLHYGNAQYYRSQELWEAHHDCVWALWRERGRGEGSYAYYLLLGVEDHAKSLGARWTNTWPAGAVDPDNALLSLPDEWQDDTAVMPCLDTKFDFRLMQLLTEMGVTPRVQQRHRTELMRAAIKNDPDMAETLLMFGHFSTRYHLSSKASAYLLEALRYVLFYYRELQPDLDAEIETLKLLRKAEPNQWWERLSVAQKTKATLLQRTAVVREPLDVLPTALRIHECLSMFIMPELEDRIVGSEAARLGKTRRDLKESKRVLSDRVEAAVEMTKLGKYRHAFDELTPLVPAKDTLWVTITDLWVLHNLITCVRKGDIETDKEEEWADILQSLAITYVSQISRTVTDKDATTTRDRSYGFVLARARRRARALHWRIRRRAQEATVRRKGSSETGSLISCE
jgi:tetratricopeptide (TPR) repeat protein